MKYVVEFSCSFLKIPPWRLYWKPSLPAFFRRQIQYTKIWICYSPLCKIWPKTLYGLVEEQFHLRCLNCRWHSVIAFCAAFAIVSIRPGDRWFFMMVFCFSDKAELIIFTGPCGLSSVELPTNETATLLTKMKDLVGNWASDSKSCWCFQKALQMVINFSHVEA